MNTLKTKDRTVKSTKTDAERAAAPTPDALPSWGLEERIRSREARVGVVGLGYVGLPLALEAARAGFPVLGLEVNQRIVDNLRRGRSHVTDISDEAVGEALDTFTPTTDWDAIGRLDAVIICVPTPLGKTKEPDLTHVIAATESVAAHIGEGTLVVLESTTYPGTTEEILLPRLEANGLKVGRDLFLAFSPERVDPGNEVYTTRTIPKVVGGVTQRCTEIAAMLYGELVDTVVPVSSPRVAETVKLLENTYRSVNIALVNEMAMMCTHMGIDVWEVIDAASTKPFGFMPFHPGPGLGGHCIPIDPIYLRWKARLDGFEPSFIDLAARINDEMPGFTVGRAMDLLNEHGKAMKGARVHVMGVTYKRNVSDVRESPALRIIEKLRRRGALVSYSDPLVDSVTVADETFEAREPGAELLAGTDLVMIVTDHDAFDYEALVEHAPLVFDTRNATRNVTSTNVTRL